MGNTVLVVDDYQEELDRHTTVLKQHGFEVVTAMTLEEAGRRYLDHREELAGVILDGCVPDFQHTTEALARQMKADKGLGLLRAVVVAASSDRLLRDDLVRAGCDAKALKEEAAELLVRLLASRA